MDGNEQREKGQEGAEGGLDESQGIPELATYTRGPRMPFLRFLCRLRQVPFELQLSSHQPQCPASCPATRYTMQVSGGQKRSLRRTQGL